MKLGALAILYSYPTCFPLNCCIHPCPQPGHDAARSEIRQNAAAGTLREDDHRKARKKAAKSRDGARQNKKQEVVAVDLDSDDEDAPIISATRQKPSRRRTTGGGSRPAVTESPPIRTSIPAAVGAVGYWEDGAQCQDERTEDGWDCHVCTFRNVKNSNVLDLACAVCTHKRCP